MTTYADPVEVMNAALTRAGAGTVTQNDGSRAWIVGDANYTQMLKARLTKHRWSFAQAEQKLVRSTDYGADARDRYGYSLPSDCLTPHEAYAGKCNIKYALFGNEARYREDRDDIVIRYTKQVVEGLWDSDFAEAFVLDLKGLFLEGLFEDRPSARQARQEANSLFEIAMVRDKNAARQFELTSDPIINRAWRGGRYETGA